MKAVTDGLGVARSNVVEREGGAAAARAAGAPAVNAKRVFRLMKKHGLLLARHGGRRLARLHEGEVATLRSNVRWCSDVLELTCWNGEAVCVAFALDGNDREVIGWLATTAGISGALICDMMIECVETGFGAPGAPQLIQWLTDNGRAHAGATTIDRALALDLEPCFTPVESPESNGMAEAFVKTFKRDDVRVNPIPDSATAIAAVMDWMEDDNTAHPHASSDAAHPASTSGPCRNQPSVWPERVNTRSWLNRPGFAGGPHCCEDGAMTRKARNRLSPEGRQRAMRCASGHGAPR